MFVDSTELIESFSYFLIFFYKSMIWKIMKILYSKNGTARIIF